MTRRSPWCLAWATALAGCTGWQSATDPRSPQAQDLDWLFWLLTLTCTAVWVVVMLVLAVAVWRRRPVGQEPITPDPRGERRSRLAVGTAVAATAVIVL